MRPGTKNSSLGQAAQVAALTLKAVALHTAPNLLCNSPTSGLCNYSLNLRGRGVIEFISGSSFALPASPAPSTLQPLARFQNSWSLSCLLEMPLKGAWLKVTLNSTNRQLNFWSPDFPQTGSLSDSTECPVNVDQKSISYP